MFSIIRSGFARLPLATALGGLKGPFMKVAQFLAKIPDLPSLKYTIEPAKLQYKAPPMRWAFVKRRRKAELGPDWLQRFVCVP